METTGGFLQQLKALLYRNYLLKRRNMKLTSQEIFFPLYFVGILVMVKALSTGTVSPPISEFQEHSLNQSIFSLNSKTILVSPGPDIARSKIIMDMVSMDLGINYLMYNNSQEMEDVYRQNSSLVGAGVEFKTTMTYEIRMPYENIASTAKGPFLNDGVAYQSGNQCRNNGTGGLSRQCVANSYLFTGFCMLQQAIDTALLKLASNNSNFPAPRIQVQMLPLGEYTPDSSYIQTLSAIFIIMAYAPFISSLVVFLVVEKERKIKETMRMMGMQDAAFWCSWVIVYAVLIAIVSALVTLLTSQWIAGFFSDRSNMFLFFITLFLYGLSLITLSFMFTPFFNKAQTAGGLAGFATQIVSLFYLINSQTRTIGPDGLPVSSVPVYGQFLMCLLSPVATALAIDQALFLDISGHGMTFSTAANVGEFPLAYSLGMLVLDFLLYGWLAWYLDNVIPGEYGNNRPFYFCFMPSFWCPKRPSGEELQNLLDPGTAGQEVEDTEPVPAAMKGKESLRIYGIKKVFKADKNDEKKRKEIIAVNGLSIDMYEGEITALLGHNGAGKTTLFNMLTGLVPVTSGNATIYNYNVTNTNDMNEIRKMTGVCPQHNVLFDTLTAREHLYIVANFKGIPDDRIDAEITQTLKDVDLDDKADTWAEYLSGGQKRKLSVAIALIGDPKVIFLDEPTAGMDPYSRRHLWSLLKERRPGKTILLTTHFMDEADILADRKAFLSKGKLRCYGSSLFLKNRFGIGYHLQMVVDQGHSQDDITALIQKHVSGAEMERVHGMELSYTLPLEDSDKFAGMFADLESNDGANTKAGSLGITSYGVSMTTLEEVFLKIGEEEEDAEAEAEAQAKEEHTTNKVSPQHGQNRHGKSLEVSMEQEDVTVNFTASPFTTYGAIPLLQDQSDLRSQRFKTLFKMRFKQIVRDPGAVIFIMIFPVLFVFIGLIMRKYLGTTPDIAAPRPFSFSTGKFMYARSLVNATQQPKMFYQNYTGGILPPSWSDGLLTQGLDPKYLDTGTNFSAVKPHHYGIKVNEWQPLGMDSSNFTAMYNRTAIHALPVALNVLSNVLLKTFNPNATMISTTSLPWPRLTAQRTFDSGSFASVILIGMAVVFMPAGFAMGIVKERQEKIKSQLRIMGVTQQLYWSVWSVFHFTLMAPSLVLIIVVSLAFQVESLMHGGAIFSLFLLFFTYIPSATVFGYCCSFMFDKFETAQTVLPNLFIFGALLPYMGVSMVDMIVPTSNVPQILHHVFCVIDPAYPMLGGFYYIDKVHIVAMFSQLGTAEPVVAFSQYFDWDNNIVIAWLTPIVHLILLIIFLSYLDIKSTGGDGRDVFKCGKEDHSEKIPVENTDVIADEDEDVKQERLRVETWDTQAQGKTPVVMVKNLRKEFPKPSGKKKKKKFCGPKGEDDMFVAVRNASFAVEKGEVFGLLGPNGAGKTTTLNMVIAEVGPTKGQVNVAGHNVHSSISDAFQAMGYCPQHDALWENITLDEHLTAYGAFRGIPKNDLENVCQYFTENLQIDEHSKKRAKHLSGGTKRKLSYAMSMLGSPQVVLLDEPSTGMDPKSKRFLWDTISSSFKGDKRGAILTTHYMEEADALCSKVAIMVNGQIRCIGSTQHLKNKYGSGYILEVKLTIDETMQLVDIEEKMDKLHAFVQGLFPEAVQSEVFSERAVYKIPQSNVVSLAQVFATLEDGKSSIGIEEYNFSQSTLEQVFLSFAKQQREGVTEEEIEDSRKRSDSRASFRRQMSRGSGRTVPVNVRSVESHDNPALIQSDSNIPKYTKLQVDL